MSQTVQSLSPAAFKAVIADKSVQLVDVRTAQEYAQGTIEHALLMDVSSVDFEQEIEKLDSSSPVAVFCHSGVRSLMPPRYWRREDFRHLQPDRQDHQLAIALSYLWIALSMASNPASKRSPKPWDGRGSYWPHHTPYLSFR